VSSESVPPPSPRRTLGPQRASAIDVRLPELSPLVDRWRRATVPVASLGIVPHATVLFPWRPPPVPEQALREAGAAVAGVAPFALTFRRLGRFEEGERVLYLCPEPDAPLRELTRRLAAAFPDTPPFGGRFGDPIPHVTIALAPTPDALARLEAEIALALAPRLPLTVSVRQLSVEEEGEDGRWSLRATLPLAG
jgi:hypothetical protein